MKCNGMKWSAIGCNGMAWNAMECNEVEWSGMDWIGCGLGSQMSPRLDLGHLVNPSRQSHLPTRVPTCANFVMHYIVIQAPNPFQCAQKADVEHPNMGNYTPEGNLSNSECETSNKLDNGVRSGVVWHQRVHGCVAGSRLPPPVAHTTTGSEPNAERGFVDRSTSSASGRE